jgi:hypothetical protein
MVHVDTDDILGQTKSNVPLLELASCPRLDLVRSRPCPGYPGEPHWDRLLLDWGKRECALPT